jgi:hypothetical protein
MIDANVSFPKITLPEEEEEAGMSVNDMENMTRLSDAATQTYNESMTGIVDLIMSQVTERQQTELYRAMLWKSFRKGGANEEFASAIRALIRAKMMEAMLSCAKDEPPLAEAVANVYEHWSFA